MNEVFVELSDFIKISKGYCEGLLKNIPSNSVDAIITDPPYLYLKKQKLDQPFDEKVFFNEAKRILKNSGFIIIFGRGTAFYRWNTILTNLNFIFKEEIIWDKKLTNNMYSNIVRVHETISIFTKKSGTINKVFVEYIENRINNLPLLLDNIKRIEAKIKKPFGLEKIIKYLSDEKMPVSNDVKNKHEIVGVKKYDQDRVCHILKTIKNGIRESSIISITSEHYTMQHPTQKPVRLMERLMQLVTKEKDLVIDPFMGSGSTGIAALNLNRRFIGVEKEDEYFTIAKNRLEKKIMEKEYDLFYNVENMADENVYIESTNSEDQKCFEFSGGEIAE